MLLCSFLLRITLLYCLVPIKHIITHKYKIINMFLREFCFYTTIQPSVEILKTLWVCFFPISWSRRSPALCARWAWYELGKQTADTLWYFLALHQLSSLSAPCLLPVRKQTRPSPFPPPHSGGLARGLKGDSPVLRVAQLRFGFNQMEGAYGFGTSENQTPTSAWTAAPWVEPPCTSDKRQLKSSDKQWRPWAEEKSSSKVGSESHHPRRNSGDMWVFYFDSVCGLFLSLASSTVKRRVKFTPEQVHLSVAHLDIHCFNCLLLSYSNLLLLHNNVHCMYLCGSLYKGHPRLLQQLSMFLPKQLWWYWHTL